MGVWKCKSQKCENEKFAQKCQNDPKNHCDTFEQIFHFHTFDFYKLKKSHFKV